jgi:putative drug exporter of the RND superfamily
MNVFRGAPSFLVRHRRAVVFTWALAAAILIPFARGVEQRLETGTRVPDSESARAAELVTTRIMSAFARYAVLVVRGVPNPASDSGRALLARIVTRVNADPAVVSTFSMLDVQDSLFVGRDEGTFVIVGLEEGGMSIDSLMPSLRGTTHRLLQELRGQHPRLELMWTGELALTADIRRVSADDANRAERRVLPLTLALLVVAFGGLTAASLPVGIGALAIALTMGSVALVTRLFPVSILVLNVATMLGLGLGIDYALLLVSRFRESRHGGLGNEGAAIEAATHAGHSIVLSGAAVLVGFLALLFVPLTDLRSIAIGGALITIVSVLLSTTLLPGVLAMLGDRVDSLRIRRRTTGALVRPTFWRRWSTYMVRHPRLVLLVAGLPTIALALQWRALQTRTPTGDWLPASIESARGLRALDAMNRTGIVYSIRMVVELPDGAPATSPRGERALAALRSHLEANGRVARVMPPQLSAEARVAAIEILPAESNGVAAAMELVREVRRIDPVQVSGVPGVRAVVGGLPAFNVDYGDTIGRATPRVVTLVVLGTFVALMIGFRSILIPLKAIVLNLLSVAAAFGAVVLVFQKGYGAGLVGLAGPLDGIFPAVPLLAFCIVFGLSMDYEVFLVSRVAEARRTGFSEEDAVIEGVSRTGGVITGAAIVMIVIFGAFTMGEFVFMKILGFALAVAVLLDVTVIRLALGPALLRLAGRWNWWPGANFSASQRRPTLAVPRRPLEAVRHLQHAPVPAVPADDLESHR